MADGGGSPAWAEVLDGPDKGKRIDLVRDEDGAWCLPWLPWKGSVRVTVPEPPRSLLDDTPAVTDLDAAFEDEEDLDVPDDPITPGDAAMALHAIAAGQTPGMGGPGDEADDHKAADVILCRLLRSLGHGDVVHAFLTIRKWYD